MVDVGVRLVAIHYAVMAISRTRCSGLELLIVAAAAVADSVGYLVPVPPLLMASVTSGQESGGP